MPKIEVTDEMRAAVYAADCERFGHQFQVSTVIRSAGEPNPNDPHGIPKPEIAGPDGQLPYISCGRCTKVWLVMENEEDDYQVAVEHFREKLKNPGDAQTKRPPRRPRSTTEPPPGYPVTHTH